MFRRNWIWLIVCCCVFLLLTLLVWLLRMPPRSPSPPVSPLPAATAAATAEPTAAALVTDSTSGNNEDTPLPYAWIGNWEGHLAVFPPAGELPQHVYEVLLTSLPEAEQRMLAEKIPIWNEIELARALEDYTS